MVHDLKPFIQALGSCSSPQESVLPHFCLSSLLLLWPIKVCCCCFMASGSVPKRSKVSIVELQVGQKFTHRKKLICFKHMRKREMFNVKEKRCGCMSRKNNKAETHQHAHTHIKHTHTHQTFHILFYTFQKWLCFTEEKESDCRAKAGWSSDTVYITRNSLLIFLFVQHRRNDLNLLMWCTLTFWYVRFT